MGNLSVKVSAGLRRIRRSYLTTKARLRGKAFFCAALAGGSEVNLCINSDLTVSCTCHDVDGTGHLGDLARDSLPAILSGPTAKRFREELARGRLPTPLCSRCGDLRTVRRDEAGRLVDRHRLPTFVMVENTSACNLRCTSCPRDQIRRLRAKVSMSLDDVRRVAQELSETGITRVGYLNLGEPFLSKRIGQELEILREVNPGIWITTSTNALLIDSDEKREAALLLDRVQISLDGIDQRMAAKYQRGMDFERAYRNMRSLVEHRNARGLDRPLIVWKYLLFRWNERKEHLQAAVRMGREAGVDKVFFEKTVSPVWGLPWRYYLGLLDGLGEKWDDGIEVDLRASAEPACEVGVC